LPLFLVLAIAAASLLASCARLEGLRLRAASVPATKALASKDLRPEARNLLELCRDAATFSAERYGLPLGPSSLRYLGGREGPLAWRLTVAPPQSLEGATTRLYAGRATAESALKAATARGWSSHLEAWDSLAFLGQAPSPVFDGLSALPMERIVEWVNRELFAASAPKRMDGAARSAFAAFAAEMATRDYLAARLSPASPVLGSYISSKRDERTFASLYPDFLSRIQGLYAQKPLPEDWAARRDFLIRTWLQDFRLNYPNRFITNAFKDFGQGGLNDAALAAWHEIQPSYADWQRRFAATGSDLARLLKELETR
jgi:predicted aminopeptidase